MCRKLSRVPQTSPNSDFCTLSFVATMDHIVVRWKIFSRFFVFFNRLSSCRHNDKSS
ncbi:hypothetical protein L195_g061374, partial [Trifolium pratense]